MYKDTISSSFVTLFSTRTKLKYSTEAKAGVRAHFDLYMTLFTFKKMLVCHKYYNHESFSLQPLESRIKFYDTNLLSDNTILHF